MKEKNSAMMSWLNNYYGITKNSFKSDWDRVNDDIITLKLELAEKQRELDIIETQQAIYNITSRAWNLTDEDKEKRSWELTKIK